MALYSFAMNKGRKLYFSNSTPSPCGHSPYIPLRKHRGRRLNTNDFLSQPKKVLVTLICVICSFFSTARRTNQEAPPQLSGFWVRRRSRRRGLRNSLRSDSPRPFSSVFLATSPPDKGGDFAHAFAGLFNPSVLADTSPIASPHPAMLRGTAGEVFKWPSTCSYYA